MADFEDYKLQNAEDEAMKNSQMAKRAILGVGAVGAVAATAYAVNNAINHDDDPISSDDITEGMNSGSVTEDILDEETAPVTNTYTTHTTINQVIIEESEPEPEIEFKESIVMLDPETNEEIGTIDKGTYGGKDFVTVDYDNDKKADLLWIDENEDHIVQQKEIHIVPDDVEIPVGLSDNLTYVDPNGERIDVSYRTDDIVYGYNRPQEFDDFAKDNPDYQNNVRFAESTDNPVEPSSDVYAEVPTDDGIREDILVIDGMPDPSAPDDLANISEPLDITSDDSFDTVDLV